MSLRALIFCSLSAGSYRGGATWGMLLVSAPILAKHESCDGGNLARLESHPKTLYSVCTSSTWQEIWSEASILVSADRVNFCYSMEWAYFFFFFSLDRTGSPSEANTGT